MGFWKWLTGNEQEEEKATAADEPVMEVADVGVKEKQVRTTREIERQIVGRRYRRDLRIDGDKLRKAILGKGLTAREVSLQMGRAQSFVSTNCADGFIKTEDLNEICEIIGASPDEFIVTESVLKAKRGTTPPEETKDAVTKEDVDEIRAMLSELLRYANAYGSAKSSDEMPTAYPLELKTEPKTQAQTDAEAKPLELRSWGEKPTFAEFEAYCKKLDPMIDVNQQWARLEAKEWKVFDWKRSINGVYSVMLRVRKKMIPENENVVADFFVSSGMQRSVAGKEAKRFIAYYEKRGWFPSGYPKNPWLPPEGWKTYAARWAINHFEWKRGETA